MSASRMPTRAPSAARARARLTAVVDLPTPPLPEATATMLPTPGSGFRLCCTDWTGIFTVISTSDRSMPGSAVKAASSASVRSARMPSAGNFSVTATRAVPPSLTARSILATRDRGTSATGNLTASAAAAMSGSFSAVTALGSVLGWIPGRAIVTENGAGHRRGRTPDPPGRARRAGVTAVTFAAGNGSRTAGLWHNRAITGDDPDRRHPATSSPRTERPPPASGVVAAGGRGQGQWLPRPRRRCAPRPPGASPDVSRVTARQDGSTQRIQNRSPHRRYRRRGRYEFASRPEGGQQAEDHGPLGRAPGDRCAGQQHQAADHTVRRGARRAGQPEEPQAFRRRPLRRQPAGRLGHGLGALEHPQPEPE